jgi:hypothetical protein
MILVMINGLSVMAQGSTNTGVTQSNLSNKKFSSNIKSNKTMMIINIFFIFMFAILLLFVYYFNVNIKNIVNFITSNSGQKSAKAPKNWNDLIAFFIINFFLYVAMFMVIILGKLLDVKLLFILNMRNMSLSAINYYWFMFIVTLLVLRYYKKISDKYENIFKIFKGENEAMENTPNNRTIFELCYAQIKGGLQNHASKGVLDTIESNDAIFKKIKGVLACYLFLLCCFFSHKSIAILKKVITIFLIVFCCWLFLIVKNKNNNAKKNKYKNFLKLAAVLFVIALVSAIIQHIPIISILSPFLGLIEFVVCFVTLLLFFNVIADDLQLLQNQNN